MFVVYFHEKTLNFLFFVFQYSRWFCFQYSCWLVDQFPKMIWRGSRTSKSPTECTDFVGFLQYIPLFMTPGFILGRVRDICGKKCLKMSLKSSIWSPFLLEDWMTLLLRRTRFFRVYFLCPFCVKNVLFLRYLFFAWTSWSILVPRLRAFCARIWNWFKTVFPTSTVFKKMPWKWKCCFQYS